MIIGILFIILVLAYLIMTNIMFMSGPFGDNIGNSEGFMSATFTVGIIALISVIFVVIESRNPTAMDVYKGKTTLEVTYKNGVAIDSTVVFK